MRLTTMTDYAMRLMYVARSPSACTPSPKWPSATGIART